MDEKTSDQELEELKEEIKKIVGEEKIKKIMEVVNSSYQYDTKIEYEITYNIQE